MSTRFYTRTFAATVEQEFIIDDQDLTPEQVAILDDPLSTDREIDEVLCDFSAVAEDYHAIGDGQSVIERIA